MEQPITITNHLFSNKRFFSRLEFLLAYYREGHILHIGNVSGWSKEGKFSSIYLKFCERIAPSNQVYGFDIESPNQKEPYLNQKEGDILEGLPYPDKFFDTIYMGEVLEHLKNPGVALSEIRRVLKDAGIFIVDVPNAYSLLRMSIYMLKRKESLGNPTHLIMYTPGSLNAILIESGFSIEEMTTDKSKKLKWLPDILTKGIGHHLLVVAKKHP